LSRELCTDVSFLLGMDAMRDRDVHFDLGNGMLELLSVPGACPADGLPLEFVHGVQALKVQVVGGRTLAGIRGKLQFADGLAEGVTAGQRTEDDDDDEQGDPFHDRASLGLAMNSSPVLVVFRFVALGRGRRGGNQGAMVDETHFYGIGNHALVKHRKDTGERVAEWFGPRGGPIVHFNAGYVEDGRLVLAHSNFPQLPMASSLEIHDAGTLQPVSSHSFGIRLGSLTWAVRRGGYWWACFSNYNDNGTTPGFDQRWTYVGQYDDRWQMLQSWLFPPQVIATWGRSACSGGDWGDDGLLYVTGHDAPELYVLRLPRQGVTLEYVTTIDVPFEGQAWAWDRSLPGQRVIYGISRARQEIIAARILQVPAGL
jgi:hypothetical protein